MLNDPCEQLPLLSLTEFIRLSKDDLVKKCLQCEVAPESLYEIIGLPHDVAKEPVVKHVVTFLVNAGAYPGPCCLFTAATTLGTRVERCLQELKECGAVAEPSQGKFRLSDWAFLHLRHVRRTIDYKPIMLPRPPLALKDNTLGTLSVP